MLARLTEFVPGLLAGMIGGYAGYLVNAALIGSQNFWIPILPGAFAGLLCGQTSPVASKPRGILNALLVFGLVVYAQWKLFSPPFVFDGTLLSYARNLYYLPGLTLIFMGVNVMLGYWWGREQGMVFSRGRRAGFGAERSPTDPG